MTPTTPEADRTPAADEAFPRELQVCEPAADDLGDWWMDLGYVAIPGPLAV